MLDETHLSPSDGAATDAAVAFIADRPRLVVTTTADIVADDGETSLREAIGFVNDGTFAPGSTIGFANGVGEAFEEGGLILLGGAELVIRESVTIDGDLDDDGTADVTVDAGGLSRVLRVDDGDEAVERDVVIDGLAVTGGKAPEEPRDSAGSDLDGLYRGGGVFSNEKLTIVSCLFSGNEAARFTTYGYGRGGALFSTGSRLVAKNSLFENNYAGARILDEIITGEGGAIYTRSETFLEGTVFRSNVSGDGGALRSFSGLAIVGSVFDSNAAGGYGAGGAIDNDGALSIKRSTFNDNVSGGVGAALAQNDGAADLHEVSFISNYGSSSGAVFTRSNAIMMISNSAFRDNSTFGAGGGLMITEDAAAVIRESLFTGSTAGEGGAIFNRGDLSIENATISGNSGSNAYAYLSGLGGGILSYGTLTVSNSTIVRNTADGGAGVAIGAGVARLQSTIVAENIGGDLSSLEGGCFRSRGNNLVGDGSGAGAFIDGVRRDIVGTTGAPIDPRLGDLADNGGPTETHALLPDSPAIDAGSNPRGLAFDQRGEGFPREIGARPDIGALEAQEAARGETAARVARSSDDAEQRGPRGAIDLDDGVLEIAASAAKLVGVRFTGLDTPEGAQIVEAYIRFRANRSFDSPSTVEIALEDDRSAQTFGTGARTIAARDWLGETVAWTPEATVKGQDFRTPDLSALIEMLLAGDDVDGSDALAFRLTGLRGRNAWSFDGSGPAPELVIVYETPAPSDGLDPFGVG